MANIKKRSKNSVSIRVVVGHRIGKDGRRRPIVKMFTAETEAEAKYAALDYQLHHKDEDRREMTVREAVQGYIESKENVLSPSTIRADLSRLQNNFDGIGDVLLSKLTQAQVQNWVNSMARSLSAKSIANIYGLMSAAVSFYSDRRFTQTRLPRRVRKPYYVPTSDEVRKLLSECSGALYSAVCLAAFGSLRAGEACALTDKDIDWKDGVIRITKDMVKGPDMQWHITAMPKTDASYRAVRLPEAILGRFKGVEGELLGMNPNMLSKRFRTVANRCGLHELSYHSLRHYFATELFTQGVAVNLVEKMGGWSRNSPVLQQIYIGVQDSELLKSYEVMTDHFGSVLDK